jgi:hypothetical protein
MGTGGPYGVGNNARILAETFNATPSDTRGVRRFEPVPLGALTLADGTTIPAAGAGNVGRGTIFTNYNGLIWNATADSGDIVAFDVPFPRDGVPMDTDDNRDLVLRVLAMKYDGSGVANDNPDLALTGGLRWHRAGTTALSLTTAPTVTLAAKSGSITGFAWYDLDFGAALAAEAKSILPGDSLQFRLSVNEAVGTNLAVLVRAIEVMWRRGFAAHDENLR